MDCSPQVSSVHGIFPGKNRLPFPPSGDLPDPGIELTSPVAPALGEFCITELPGKNPPQIISTAKQQSLHSRDL